MKFLSWRFLDILRQSQPSNSGATWYPFWGRGRCSTAYLWRCLFLASIMSLILFFSLLLPTGLLSLNSLFTSIYDIDGCATSAVSLVSGWVFTL